MNLSKKRVAVMGLALVSAITLGLVGGGLSPEPAQAATPPYTVDASGIALTDGSSFQDGGHVNIEVEGKGQTNLQFESKCTAAQAGPGDRPECFQGAITRHDMAQFIGQKNIPWSAFGLSGSFCVIWVQISHLNAHFGVDFGTKYCTGTTGQCVAPEAFQEYKYSQVIKGQEGTSHTEWRFQTRTVTYGEVEHKYVPGHQFVDGGTTTVNGQTVSGHWMAGDPNTWYAIPDSIINIVWGSGGIPNQYIGGSQASPKGSVDLDTYGYPGNGPTVPYYATKESNPSGYTAWGPWSNWSTTNPGASNDTRNVESRQVSDNNAVPDKTVYYLPGGSQSDTNTDANWTTETPASPWVKIDQRTSTRQVTVPCPQTASASVVVDQQETCLASSTVKAVLTNATLDNPLDQSVGTHTASFTAESGHNFTNGTATFTVEYTVKAADPSLCPQNASASASVGSQATCTADSTPLFTINNATWETAAVTTVGTHERWAMADPGHLFPGGDSRLKVTYTITAADPSLCPKDASATVSVVTQESCTADSTVKLNLVNATVDPSALPLPTKPGTYSVPVIADPYHLFANGTSKDVVTVVIKAKLNGGVCAQLPMLAATGQGNPWLIAVGALAALLIGSGVVFGVRRAARTRQNTESAHSVDSEA